MIDLTGYEDVQGILPGEFIKLPAGGYICRIVNVEYTKSKAGNPMLVFFLDIDEGEFKSHFQDAFDRIKSSRSDIKWDNSAIYRQLIFDKDGKTSRFFKGLLTCIEKSNPSFHFNPRFFDEQSLRNKFLGFIFAEEEWERNGKSGIRTFAKFPKTVEDIRNNNFSVPALKKLSPAQKPVTYDELPGETIDPDDTPF